MKRDLIPEWLFARRRLRAPSSAAAEDALRPRGVTVSDVDDDTAGIGSGVSISRSKVSVKATLALRWWCCSALPIPSSSSAPSSRLGTTHAVSPVACKRGQGNIERARGCVRTERNHALGGGGREKEERGRQASFKKYKPHSKSMPHRCYRPSTRARSQRAARRAPRARSMTCDAFAQTHSTRLRSHGPSVA